MKKIILVIAALLTIIALVSVLNNINIGNFEDALPGSSDGVADNTPEGGDTSGGDTSGGDTSGGDTSGGDTSGGDTSGTTDCYVMSKDGQWSEGRFSNYLGSADFKCTYCARCLLNLVFPYDATTVAICPGCEKSQYSFFGYDKATSSWSIYEGSCSLPIKITCSDCTYLSYFSDYGITENCQICNAALYSGDDPNEPDPLPPEEESLIWFYYGDPPAWKQHTYDYFIDDLGLSTIGWSSCPRCDAPVMWSVEGETNCPYCEIPLILGGGTLETPVLLTWFYSGDPATWRQVYEGEDPGEYLAADACSACEAPLAWVVTGDTVCPACNQAITLGEDGLVSPDLEPEPTTVTGYYYDGYLEQFVEVPGGFVEEDAYYVVEYNGENIYLYNLHSCGVWLGDGVSTCPACGCEVVLAE